MFDEIRPEGSTVSSAELKKKAETKGEKATIEIVALMFQAILAEERIPPGIRVWFARLQMPVLRVALEDPDFFGTATGTSLAARWGVTHSAVDRLADPASGHAIALGEQDHVARHDLAPGDADPLVVAQHRLHFGGQRERLLQAVQQ